MKKPRMKHIEISILIKETEVDAEKYERLKHEAIFRTLQELRKRWQKKSGEHNHKEAKSHERDR